jgi:hypothetical protein
MERLTELRAYVPRLAGEFDRTLHPHPEFPDAKGWGQFLSAEHLQVGLYGTCSEILVKTVASRQSPIDKGVREYLVCLWRNRQGETERYFNQTVRVAFLVLALARVADPQLLQLRAEAMDELTERQRPDGAWGDWGSGDAPPRIETTAWAVLALMYLQDHKAEASARLGAQYLQRQVSAVQHIDQTFDAFILGVVLHTLPPSEIGGRVLKATIKVLTDSSPSNDLQIYFFDFTAGAGAERQLRRDFLCVPRFFGYCLLASAPSFGSNRDSPFAGSAC